MKLSAIKDAVEQGRIEWLNHSLKRMLERGIARSAVKNVLTSGEVVEDYPGDVPYPSALLMGVVNEEPLHVVIAYDSASGYCMIVTVYRPDLAHFEDDCRTRRSNG